MTNNIISFCNNPDGDGIAIFLNNIKVGDLLTMADRGTSWNIGLLSDEAKEILSDNQQLADLIPAVISYLKESGSKQLMIGNTVGQLGLMYDEKYWTDKGFHIGHSEDIPATYSTTYYALDI